MGQRVDEEKMFNSYDDAIKFKNKFNSENNLNYTPNWYMYADGPHPIK